MSRREEELLRRLKEATIALRDTLDERDALLREKHEPVAIVGVSCRFPGGAESLERYWELLAEGRDGVGPLSDRWELVGGAPGETAPRWGGLLTAPVDRFDAAFFGISPREAQSLDPQQRLLHEVTWEAFEDAGIPVDKQRGGRVGVFVGATNTDFADLVEQQPAAELDAYSITGNLLSVAAGRLSYTFGFQGPSLTVDTVCSSSLVAVHLACQSLRRGECTLAIAAAVNLILSPKAMEGVARTQALAPDGRCKTFDALANGFARGEGCGGLLLKRLSDAERDGDRIHALIRGSAVNQDGASTGLTAPNVRAQESMLRDALADARVRPESIGFVETHGTGTSLGDPIEVEALRSVLGAPRADGSRCVLGAVKTNLGHLEAAAGMAGLLKVVLALEHEMIPQNLHLRAKNPRIELDGSSLDLAVQAIAWPRCGAPRIGGVSAFGLSGTNAHVILEEAPTREAQAPESSRAKVKESEPRVLVLSAKTGAALSDRIADLLGHLGEGDVQDEGGDLNDLAFSLATTRASLDHRLAITASCRAELVEALGDLAEGRETARAYRSQARSLRGRLAFVCTGQGSQLAGMGRGLAEVWPVFRAAFDRCADLFEAQLGCSLREVMWAEEGSDAAARLDQTGMTQPALFTLQYALLELWRSWGVEPTLLAGHSIGEYAAAWAAGVFSLADAVRLVSARGRLMQALPAGGAMLVLPTTEAKVREAIVAYTGPGSADIAAINGPESVVIAGDEVAVEAVAASIIAGVEGAGAKVRRLKVSHAFHSSRMDPMLTAFAEVAATVEFCQPTRSLVSCLTGALAGPEIASPEYWIRHVREPVRFADCARGLAQAGAECFVEIGPRPALLTSIQATLAPSEPTLIASLRGRRPEPKMSLDALAQVWTRGGSIAWGGVFLGGGRRLPLPLYPWQRRRYWPVLPAKAPIVSTYYDELALVDSLAAGESELDGGERYLTFAPFAAPVPGFSWLLATVAPQAHPEQAKQVIAAQREMREVIFRGVDLSAVQRGLDIGCGYGTDLVRLGKEHPHLTLHGHTISAEQAKIGDERIRRAGLSERVEVLHRDSTQGPYIADYDLVWGIEVACHIRDKESLFATIGAHLRVGGTVVLSDFISSLSSDIEHEPSSSYLATAERWAEVLAAAHLRLEVCVDVSPEIANFLEDPDFDRNLEVLRGGADGAVDDSLRSYDQLSRLLRRRMASYVLLRARRVADSEPAQALFHDNLRALSARTPYAQARGSLTAGPVNDGRFLEQVWARAVTPAARVSSGRWLLLGEGGGLGRALHDSLIAAGHRVRLISEVVPSPTRARAILMEAFEGAAPTALVHLGCLSQETSRMDDPLDALDSTLASGPESMLAMLQGLQSLQGAQATAWRDPPRLWLMTRGAQCLREGDPVAVEQAALVGIGRVVAMEHADLRCVRVDLDPSRPAEECAHVHGELVADDVEDEIAWRDGQRWVARVVRCAPEPATEGVNASGTATIRPDGAYLITGGLGGLGLTLAHWLASKGAGHIVLLGRRGVTSDVQREAIAAIEAGSTQVTVHRADIGERADVEALFDAIGRGDPPLRGIIHAAGVADPAMLADLTPARLRAVMAPKARGALLLDALTVDLELDFFVLYGSVAGLFGLGGTGNYAAANTLLDALAHRRRSAGRPALCVDWGFFGGVGLAAQAAPAQASVFSAGMRSMTTEEGTDALERLLRGSRVQVGVVPLDGAQWVESFPAVAASRRLAPLFAGSGGVDRGAPVGDPQLLARLARASATERQALVLEAVLGYASHVLRIPTPELNVEVPLTELGMDSLMGLELRNRIEVGLGQRVSPTLLWTYPTVRAISEHLAVVLAGSEQARTPAGTSEGEGADTDDDRDTTDEMTLDEAARLIDEEFEALL